MNVILMERVMSLGNLGDEVSVKNGYARNFLIPTGKAVRATAENREVFEHRRAELTKVANDRLNDAQGRAALLVDREVTIVARASEEGKLYGSVGTVEIARALDDLGVSVNRAEVRMPDGVIRSVGEHDVDIQLHADVVQPVHVVVIAE